MDESVAASEEDRADRVVVAVTPGRVVLHQDDVRHAQSQRAEDNQGKCRSKADSRGVADIASWSLGSTDLIG